MMATDDFKADRELLELAAKAAGLRVKTWDGHASPMCAIDDDRHGRMWMPLADDGDALRLAVEIGFIVNMPSPIGSSACVKFYDIEVSEPVIGKGRLSATRRAIVRAAAAIGATL